MHPLRFQIERSALAHTNYIELLFNLILRELNRWLLEINIENMIILVLIMK